MKMGIKEFSNNIDPDRNFWPLFNFLRVQGARALTRRKLSSSLSSRPRPVFIKHSQEHSLSFFFRFGEFECNTTYDSANQKLCYIQMLLNIKKISGEQD